MTDCAHENFTIVQTEYHEDGRTVYFERCLDCARDVAVIVDPSEVPA